MLAISSTSCEVVSSNPVLLYHVFHGFSVMRSIPMAYKNVLPCNINIVHVASVPSPCRSKIFYMQAYSVF